MAAPSYRLVWTLFVGAWIGNYLVRMALPALLPPIIRELGLSYASAGLLATSSFFYAYAVAQFPAGLLGDRLGRRLIVVIGLLAGAAASVFTGLAGGFVALLLARVATGLAQGCLFSNDRAIIAAVTPREQISVGQAVSFSGPGLGITLGLLLGGLLGSVMPWRSVFFVVAVAPLVAALLIARLVPDTAPRAIAPPLGARVRHVMRQPDLWVLGLSGSAVMWAQYGIATWAPVLFLEGGVQGLERAAFLASLQGLAGVGGLLAGGLIGDRVRRSGVGHKVVISASLVGTALGLVVLGTLVYWRQPPGLLLVAVLVTCAFAWSVWGPCFALLGDLSAGEDVSTAFGLYNTLCVLGAAVGPLALGWAHDLTGTFAVGCWGSAAVALAGAVAALAVTPAWRLAPPPARV